MPEQATVPDESEESEQEPSSTRVRPDQIKQSIEHAPEPADSDALEHMGAAGDEVIHDKPPTDALDKLLRDDEDHSSNDELTPG